MTDHTPTPTTEEGRRVMALAALLLCEARARAGVAKVLLEQLANHSRDLTREDQHDYAMEVWGDFRGDAARLAQIPLEIQASVFARAAIWLSEETLIRLAKDAWGERPIDITEADGLHRVVWMPDDEMLILRVGHLHTDGTSMLVDLVVSPMRMAGWAR